MNNMLSDAKKEPHDWWKYQIALNSASIVGINEGMIFTYDLGLEQVKENYEMLRELLMFDNILREEYSLFIENKRRRK